MANSNVRASIIIVNYNGGDKLHHCLLSLQQSYETRCDVVVVDNASTDGSPESIERLFPDVRLICSQENRGFGAGNNLGVKMTVGEYLAFLNPDTIVEPGWLEALISTLEAYPDAGLVTSRILLRQTPQSINTCGNEIHFSGLTLCRGMGLDREAFTQPHEVSAVSGAAFAIRRSLFETLGGFDQDFFLYMEDTDLSMRARLAGYRCLCAPDSVVYHDYTLKFGPKKTYYQERNRYMMLLKNLHWASLILLLPALLLAEVVTWGFVLIQEPQRLRNKTQAYAWVLKNWSSVMRKRRQVQDLRRVRDRELVACHTYSLNYGQTGTGWIPRLAKYVFDPVFAVLFWFTKILMNW